MSKTCCDDGSHHPHQHLTIEEAKKLGRFAWGVELEYERFKQIGLVKLGIEVLFQELMPEQCLKRGIVFPRNYSGLR